jgi:hypothetical protein
VAQFHGAGLYGIEHLQRRHDLAGRERAIWNLPSVISPTRLAMYSAPPKSVSRLFGQLAAMRHWMLGRPGVCCAFACAASSVAPAAEPRPAFLRNSRLFIDTLL